MATLGSNQAPAFETRIEIYKPWYMFMPNRPVVTGGPPSLRLGQAGTFTYSSAYGVSSVRLLRPQLSVTHSTDSDQRMASVAWKVAATGQLSVTMPAFAATVPPGYCYLVVLDNRGVPAAARWLRITT